MKKWTNKMVDYLKQIYHGKSNYEIANLINKKFNTNFTRQAVSTKKVKLKLKSNYKYAPKYTPEVIDFILENYKDKDNIELANLINEKFDLNVTGDAISMFKANYKRRFGVDLRTGINRGCFSKGSIPMNKGKKWDEYLTREQQERAKTTWFKKGNISANNVPIGTERIGKDEYIEIKVQDGKGNKNWVSKQRFVYESMYGNIPPKHKVIFLDGNNRNFDPNNLKAVSNAEELIMNKNNLRYDSKELTETGHLIAQIISKRGKIKNERL